MKLIKQILDTENKTLPEVLLAMHNADFEQVSAIIFGESPFIQQEILKEIISFARETEFGHKYDFDHINNIDDFRQRVPITSWHDYEPYADRLAKGESVQFIGFGSFCVNTRGTRTGRNPHTGEQITIPSYKQVCFKQGNLLKQKINSK